ncbi:MAG: PHP domain-containing protein [Synechococcales bacterium]|nr:PHP domain-containing protein [Cyanobacteria bacterium REEB444]MEB3125528.1 PHP domain-containing protein [Synechococcales bacterium]
MVANSFVTTYNSQVAPLSVQHSHLNQVFKAIDGGSCPYSYNFHLHTTSSDGQLLADELIEQAFELGLKGLAITDHHSLNGYYIAHEWLAHHPTPLSNLPQLWTGIEISADLLDNEVHILGFAFDPHHPSLIPYLTSMTAVGNDYTATAVIDAIHQAGGVAVLAHPCRYRKSADQLVAAASLLGIDGLETYYAYDNPKPWRASPHQTVQVKALAQQYNLFTTCGTDTHGKSILYRI